LVLRILKLLNEHMGQLYHTKLINNAYNHHDFSQVPVSASFFQEPDEEAGLVEISAIPPLLHWSVRQYCHNVERAGSISDQQNSKRVNWIQVKDMAGHSKVSIASCCKICVLTEPGVVWHYRP